MSEPTKHLVLIAGEASGDLHGAHLAKEIKSLDPGFTFSGLGGQNMRQQDVDLYYDMTGFAIVGFVEVLKHLNDIRDVFEITLEEIKKRKPCAVILIDYPGFNIRLAKKLKKENIKVIYYISPQIWAWKKNRIKLIRKYVDKMLVFFKFEKELYAKNGIPVELIGHPLLDTVKASDLRDAFLETIGLSKDKLTIGLLPGSRKKEVEVLLPIMLETAGLLLKKRESIQFMLIKAPTIDKTELEKKTREYPLPLKIVEQRSYEGLHAADLCLVASGTATLETAILRKPMVIIYKTSLFTWLLAKLFVKIPYIGLVNVVAGKKIVPECIQFQATPKLIVNELESIFSDELRIAQIKAELENVKNSLGEPGANRRAAKIILETISRGSR